MSALWIIVVYFLIGAAGCVALIIASFFWRHDTYCCYCGENITHDDDHFCEGISRALYEAQKEQEEKKK